MLNLKSILKPSWASGESQVEALMQIQLKALKLEVEAHCACNNAFKKCALKNNDGPILASACMHDEMIMDALDWNVLDLGRLTRPLPYCLYYTISC